MPASANPSRPLWTQFAAFLAPMMLSNILQALSGTINNIYLGRMIGPDALAAAAVFFPVMFFFIALVLGMGAGASVLIGQAWGRRDLDRVRDVAATTTTTALLAGLAIALVLTPLARTLMTALGTPAAILPGAVSYATIILASMPIAFAFLLMTQLLRGVGDTLTPLLALVVSLAISMSVTPALIQGWFGLPRLGVASAAIATMSAWTVTLAIMVAYLNWRRSPLAPNRRFVRAMRPDRHLLAQVLRLGVPSALQMVIMALAEMVLLGLVNRYGADATASYGAVNQVLAYVQFPAMSIGITVTILSAQAIGAGRTARLPAILRTGMLFNAALTGTLVLLAYLFSGEVVGLFFTRPSVVATTQSLLHIVLWSAVVYGAALILAGQMRASGVVLVPTALQIACIALVEVPTAWLLSARIGLDGVWVAYPAAFVAMLLGQSVYFIAVWRHRPVTALV
jgi:putative MATE family efflux protein